jgi:hypothetical protein
MKNEELKISSHHAMNCVANSTKPAEAGYAPISLIYQALSN